jgi:hypothetical protein
VNIEVDGPGKGRLSKSELMFRKSVLIGLRKGEEAMQRGAGRR